ncbi:MAG: DUF308 domain-containing protein [Methanosphaera sp.]|nr:DUF308 domain-containing protein [Methanosphaera sp.]
MLILLGLIAILFPQMSTMTVSVVTGIMFLLIGLLMIISASVMFKFNRNIGILTVILAILSLIISWCLMFNQEFLSTLVSYIIYILGFFMIMYGGFSLVVSRHSKPMLILGLASILFGIIYMIVGNYVSNPVHLGGIIGIYLIFLGVTAGFNQDKDYIDV